VDKEEEEEERKKNEKGKAPATAPVVWGVPLGPFDVFSLSYAHSI